MTQALAPSPAPSDAKAFPALRPYDAGALARAAKVAASAGNWRELVAVLQQDAAGPPALIRALAWGLETPVLLRWVCLAARLEEVLAAREPRSQALIDAEKWLREGDEPLRYSAQRHAVDEEFATPGALAAMAVFLSGPSLGQPDQPADPPPPNLARSTAGSALTATAGAPALAPDGFGRINLIGLDLAGGGDGRAGARDALAGAKGE